MAYTSVIPVRRLKGCVDYVLDEAKTSRGQNAKSLEEAVDYALNRAKTEQDLFESAIACTCKTAFEDMCQVKEMWHMQPEVKKAGKEKIKEKARESIRERLAKGKVDADRDNRERWEREGRIAPKKKHDMEL